MTAHVLQRLDDATELASKPAPRAEPARGLAITAQWLEKSFGANQVLRGLDFYVPAGQFVAIVGRSGCGKSTLLRLLLSLDRPSGGQFWFGDRADEKTDKSAVRVMFQEPRLLPWASVLSNVEVGLGRAAEIARWPRARARSAPQRRARKPSRRLAVGSLRRPKAARCAGAGAGQPAARAGVR